MYQLDGLKNKLIDRILNLSMIAVVVLAVLNLVRLIQFGWQSVYIAYFLLYLAVFVVGINKSKFSYTVKIITSSSIFILGGISALISYGSTGSHFLLIIGLSFLLLIGGKNLSNYFLLIIVVVYVVIGWLHVKGFLIYRVDMGLVQHSPIQWILVLASVLVLYLVIGYTYNDFLDETTDLYKSNVELNQQLENQNIELKETIEQLTRSESIVNKLSKNITNGMFFELVNNRTTSERKFLFVSDSVETLFDVSKEDALTDSNSVLSKIYEADLKQLLETEHASIEKMEQYEFTTRIITKDGSTKWLLIKATPTKEDDLVVWDGFVSDITQIKQKELDLADANFAIEKSRNRFKALADSSPWAIFICNESNHEINYVNPTFSKMFGYKADEFETYEKWRENAYPDASYREWVFKQREQNLELALEYNTEVEPLETIVQCKDGSKKNIQWCIVQFGVENWSFGLDLTNIRKAENELVAAKNVAEENDKLKTAFLMNLSHEIRTPLNGIIGMSDFLSFDNISQAEKEMALTVMRDSSFRLINTMNDIIELSRIETGLLTLNMQEFKFNNLVEELYAALQSKADKKQIGFKIETIGNMPIDVIKSDYDRLNRLLYHLADNAIKFTNEGQVQLQFELKNQQLIIDVSDTGIGIPEDKLEFIFGRFTQVDYNSSRKFEGSGLGLPIVKAYLEMLDGILKIKSVLNKGTKVELEIPVEEIV